MGEAKQIESEIAGYGALVEDRPPAEPWPSEQELRWDEENEF